MIEEKVYFKTSDNLTLCGILTFAEQSTHKCIILCHGITVDKEEGGIFTGLAQKLAEKGYLVFRFDFRGHGESKGNSVDMTIKGETEDIESALKYLEWRGSREFGLVAASFAGGPASFFVSKHEDVVKALVLWNAEIDYASWKEPILGWCVKYWGKPALERAKKSGFTEIGSGGFKAGLKLVEEVFSIKPWKELLKLEIPVLFVHGNRDNDVPYEDSVKYSKIVKNGKLVTIEGAEHGFHDKEEDAEQADHATIDFFLQNL